MSRRFSVAIGTLFVAFAACAAVAQSADGPSARWVAAVSGKPVASAKPVSSKSDSVVTRGAKPVVAIVRHAPKTASVSPTVAPARAFAPSEKEATRTAPAARRVGKKSRLRAETPRHRSAERRIPTKRSAELRDIFSRPAAKRVVVVREKPLAAKPAALTVPKPTAAEKAPTVVRHTNGRPDIMASAARDEKQGKSEEGANESNGSTALSMMLKLAVVLGLAYLTVRVLKWFGERRDSTPRVRKDMKIVDTVRLSGANSMHLIEVKGKTVLIGCSSGQVSLLGEFDGAELPPAEEGGESRFADYLAKYSGNGTEKTPAGRVAGLLRDCTTYLRTRQLDGSAEESAIADEA